MAATPMTAGQGTDQERQIVAVFETFDRARTARDRLAEEGIPAADMDIVHHAGGDDTAPPGQRDDRAWGFIRRFFVPAEERGRYAEGLRRGHMVLVVRPPADARHRVIELLESFDPVDFDARMEEWRSSGWTGAATAPQGHAQEQVRTGRRVTGSPGVRVRSYVVEPAIRAARRRTAELMAAVAAQFSSFPRKRE